MEETGVVSRRERRQKWQGHVEEWRCSGLKVSAYCVANGLNTGQFWYWRRALSPNTQEKGSGFMEVTGVTPGNAVVKLMIRGETISVCEGFDPSLLREVVDSIALTGMDPLVLTKMDPPKHSEEGPTRPSY